MTHAIVAIDYSNSPSDLAHTGACSDFLCLIEMCSEIGGVRLIGSANMTEGRLELCADGHLPTTRVS